MAANNGCWRKLWNHVKTKDLILFCCISLWFISCSCLLSFISPFFFMFLSVFSSFLFFVPGFSLVAVKCWQWHCDFPSGIVKFLSSIILGLSWATWRRWRAGRFMTFHLSTLHFVPPTVSHFPSYVESRLPCVKSIANIHVTMVILFWWPLTFALWPAGQQGNTRTQRRWWRAWRARWRCESVSLYLSIYLVWSAFISSWQRASADRMWVTFHPCFI